MRGELDGGWSHTGSVAIDPPAGTDRLAVCRDVLTGAPRAFRWFLSVGWGLLLLDLRRRDPSRVLGWRVVDREPDRLVLQATSRLGLRSTLVFTARNGRLSFDTAIDYLSRLGRLIWLPVAPIHRLSVGFLLRRAARRSEHR